MNTIKNKRILFCARVLLVLMVVFSCCITVIAADNTGSIRLTCRGKAAEQAVPLAGDRYALVRIAQGRISESGAAVTYSTCPAFEEYDCDWAGLSASESRDLARKLAEVVVQTGNYERSGTTDKDGIVTFTGLSAGLYLLVRVSAEPANAQFLFDPCFQWVPQIVNGEPVYQIEASPKYVTEKPEQPPKLPQTGQLNWPVPVLLVSGMICFLTGMEMSFGRRKTEDAE